MRRAGQLILVLLAASGFFRPAVTKAGGVTLITHGLNGSTSGWITGMAGAIPAYRTSPGTNFTVYKLYFVISGGNYVPTWTRMGGGAPAATDTGEIVVMLDWSQLSDGNSFNTSQIAAMTAPALMDTNFISELGGHALAELPLHLIGHSRGGSLVCELSRLLGTNGVWVDHLTTLDPHPLNNDGFTLDHFIYSAVDAPARTYQNVLFHDNYWQNQSFPIYGEPVAGAYVRMLTSLSGGYSGAAAKHSDVHLWYHGTIALATPTSDTEASITSAERSSWWTTNEQQGTNAGFEYTLVGGSNRLSTNMPVGQGFPAIRDGFNQWWDLGAGTSANRTTLTTNNGAWPSLIRFNRADTNAAFQGQSILVSFYYQWAQPAASNGTLSFYLDNDLNPLTTNQNLLLQTNAPGTGSSELGYGAFVLPLAATNASPGWHYLFATISGGGMTRFLYAPERVLVLPPPAPVLSIARINPAKVGITVNGLAGQSVVLQSSSNFVNWVPLATNTLVTNTWVYTNSAGTNRQFYRALLNN